MRDRANGKRLILLMASVLPTASVFAGGSEQTVELIHLSKTSQTDFVMTLKPRPDIDGYEDFHMGKCDVFVVLGKFRTKGLTESGFIPGKEDHLKAIEHIQETNEPFKFGWMGSGFKVLDKTNPCTVESRSLKHYEGGAILSWYTGT